MNFPAKGAFAFLFVIIFFTCCSSTNRKDDNNKPLKSYAHFIFGKKSVYSDPLEIQSVACYGGNLICLLGDRNYQKQKLVVLDSSYHHLYGVEEKLNEMPFEYLFSARDTVFLISGHKFYYLSPGFVLKRSHSLNQTRATLLEDSSYSIYGGCAGEFGGSIFFQDKKKLYSYPATCPTQVLKNKNTYLICNNLRHMNGTVGFIQIADPTKLYLLPDIKPILQNWWVRVDSIYKNYNNIHLPGVSEYFDTSGIISLLTFTNKDEIYSILNVKSKYMIAIHDNKRLIIIDSISINNNKRSHLDRFLVSHMGDKFVCGYNYMCYDSLPPKGTLQHPTSTQSGLIVVEGDKILFLDFEDLKNK
ncbi:MAG: hypothetical protein P4L41_09665 [Flavipsychrobacter sp.]|nr:hypothetical protein [Flavipsychrobacter sp.]